MKERIVRAVAGTFVLTSIALAHFVNINWLWLAVFVGANLLQSSLLPPADFCPLNADLCRCAAAAQRSRLYRRARFRYSRADASARHRLAAP